MDDKKDTPKTTYEHSVSDDDLEKAFAAMLIGGPRKKRKQISTRDRILYALLDAGSYALAMWLISLMWNLLAANYPLPHITFWTVAAVFVIVKAAKWIF